MLYIFISGATVLISPLPPVLPSVLSAGLSSQPSSVSVEALVLEELLGLADTLAMRGVGMLGCQKVVHPLLKERLREQVRGSLVPGLIFRPSVTIEKSRAGNEASEGVSVEFSHQSSIKVLY